MNDCRFLPCLGVFSLHIDHMLLEGGGMVLNYPFKCFLLSLMYYFCEKYYKPVTCMPSHFSDPMDGSPPGSSVHGILQARILEWAAMPSFRGICLSRDHIKSRLRFLRWQVGSLLQAPPGKPYSTVEALYGQFC